MPEESAPQIGLIGRTIAGKYAIESLLGVGAMGAVFKARHLGLEQFVAIKVMHPHFLAEPKFADRFRREAQATVRLDHPNSVRVFDFGEEPDGLLYLAMELLDGRDLASVIVEDWPLSSERVAGILRQVVGALGAAHDAEIIHRDLKPENVMVLARVDDDGKSVDLCKVCDFGIAQLGDPRSSRIAPTTIKLTKLTSHGLIIGTPEYMSPEQGRGDPLDARADLYSMGVLLYELLTGQLPFQADSAIGLILKHASKAVLPPSQLRSTVHPGLEAICLRAMEKEPAARFQSAREMRTALNALSFDALESARSTAPPPSVLRPETETAMSVAETPKKRAPHRAITYLAIAAVVAPVVGFVVLHFRAAPPVAATIAHSEPLQPLTEVTSASAPVAETLPAPPAPSDPAGKKAPPPAPVTRTAVVEHPAAPPPQIAAVELAPVPSASPAVAPEPPPPIVATPSPAVVAPPAPAFDPSGAHVTVGAVSNEQGALRRDILAAMSRVTRAMNSCYQSDLRAVMVPNSGAGMLHLETDESGVVVRSRVSAAFSPGVASCIERATNGIRIAGVDTGDASADVALTFDAR